jgi:predicted  nucleic acid-binding Zn-ribbon protein
VAERQWLSDLARNLVSEQERGIALEERTRMLEAERNARTAELRVANDRLQDAVGHRETLERELASLRDERSRLENELNMARRKADQEMSQIRAENAELRRRIEEVAEDILKFAEADQTQSAPARPAS